MSVYKKKLVAGTFWYEVLSLSPFLLLLLAFELIPAVAKLVFPPSSYDYLVANEDLYYQLNATIPKDLTIHQLIKNHFAAVLPAVGINDLKLLDDLEKSKNDELKHSTEQVMESVSVFMQSLVAVLGLFATGIIAIILFGCFVLVVFFTIKSYAGAASFTDIGSYWEQLKQSIGFR